MKYLEMYLVFTHTHIHTHAHISSFFPSDTYFAPIDLRWGINKNQSQAGRVISLCLDYIKTGSPYFICLLGEEKLYIFLRICILMNTIYILFYTNCGIICQPSYLALNQSSWSRVKQTRLSYNAFPYIYSVMSYLQNV